MFERGGRTPSFFVEGLCMSTPSWLNPPPHHEWRGESLFVRTGKNTDFWRDTFYGFRRDDGHFLHRAVEGDFSAEVTIKAKYDALYDQAGLMARLGPEHWVKTGVEYTDGATYFSVVITNGTSDWSIRPVRISEAGLRLRLTRHAEAIRIQLLENDHWLPVRLGYLPPSRSIDVGMMCCSPQREGFEVMFEKFEIKAAIGRELHG
jgi:uncharacterized protein